MSPLAKGVQGGFRRAGEHIEIQANERRLFGSFSRGRFRTTIDQGPGTEKPN
jgi:hypothetical protein